MKKITFLFLLLSVTVGCFAHIITPTCATNGRFKFQGSLFPTNGNVRVTVVNSQDQPVGIFDTVFASKATFTFSIPKPANINYRIRVRSQNSSGNIITWEGFSQTTSAVCSTLPLKFGSFKVEDLGDKVVKVSCTTYDETDMDRINITMSREGLEFKIVLVLMPRNVNTEYTYTGIIDLKNQLK
jgi:hypothetical protein